MGSFGPSRRQRLACLPGFILATWLTAAALGCAAPPIALSEAMGSLSGKTRLEGVYGAQGAITLKLEGPNGTFVTQSDARGLYAFTGIPTGRYTLTASRERYFPVTLADVEVAAETTLKPLTLRNHRPLATLGGLYDASRVEVAEDPEFGGTVPTRSPFLTNLTLSPDGTRLGFIQDGAVRSIRLDGSDPRVEKPLPAGLQADWLDWGKRGFLLRTWSGTASASITLIAEAGAETLVPAGQDETFAPVFAPDETEIAYIRFAPETQSPQLMRVSLDAPRTPVLLIDLLDRLHLRGVWDGTYGLMFSPLAWRSEGLMFHAPMTCQLERSGFTLGKDGIYVLRDPHAPEAEGALHKAHFYSYYQHAFSHDGTRLLYGYGPEIRSKSLSDPVVTAAGDTVGYHSDETYSALTPSPDGDRLFYLTPTGIEEMLLLP